MPTLSPDTTIDESEAAQLLELTTVLTRDTADRITRWTAGCERLYGFTREEALGSNSHALLRSVFPASLENIREIFWQTGRWKGEVTHLAKDGKPLAILSEWVLHQNARGGPPVILENNQDITDRKAAEARLKRFYQADVVGLLYWNLDGGVIDANDTFLEMVGYSRDDLRAGLDWVRMTPPEYWPLDEHARDQIRRTGKHIPFEKEFIRKDGSRVITVCAAAAWDDNRHEGVSFILDITDRKRIERALRESEARLRITFDKAPVGILEVDAHDRFINVNDRVCQMLGYSREELLQMDVHQLTAPEDRARSDELNRELHEGEIESFHYEKRYIRRDGSRIWAHVTVSAVKDVQTGQVRHIGIVEDITERKLALEALRENEERFRTLADNIAQLVWMADANGEIFWYNKRWYEYTGTTLQQMREEGWQTVHHPEHAGRVLEKFLDCIKTGEPWEDTFPLRARDGTYRWFLSRAIPIHDENGRVVRWFGTNTDITDQRNAEEALQQAKERLARTNEDLEQIVRDRTAKLQETVAELEHFSYTITHDMRAPLRAMQGFGEILTQECLGCQEPSARDYVRRICSAAERMDALITDALTFSKAVREQLQLEPVDPLSLLEGMVESYPEFQSPRAEIRLSRPMPTVLGNKAAMTQCFSNLLGNAVKFVKPGETPKVHVWAQTTPANSSEPAMVRFWFEDNGIGIPAEYHQTIFVMFHQLNRSYAGTGIGLALVRKVVERMGGRVGVASAPGQGSRFWIDLRIAQSRAALPPKQVV